MVENSQQSSGASFERLTNFRIGDVSVEVDAEDYSDFALAPVLGLFRAHSKIPDIRLKIVWVSSLCDSKAKRLFDSGATWRLYECGTGFRFDFATEPLNERPYKSLIIDKDFREGRVAMSKEFFAELGRDCVPLEYPLDELLIIHRLTQERAIELHSCGIVRADGTGNLFVGHSGAGKSTTTRLWTEREDVEVLSDDRIIVRRDEGALETPRGDAGGGEVQQVLRLRDRLASPTGHFAQDDRLKTSHFAQDDNSGIRSVAHDDRARTKRSVQEDKAKKTSGMRMYGTPWHGEAMFASPGSAPLSRIFILEHGHGNVLTRLSPSQAVAELFARSFVPFHRHEYVDSALDFLQELVGAVPVYHYAFEPNEAAVERILEFRD